MICNQVWFRMTPLPVFDPARRITGRSDEPVFRADRGRQGRIQKIFNPRALLSQICRLQY